MQLPAKSPSQSLANLQFHGSHAHLQADPEDFERHQRVLNKRHERITSHLDCFMRLRVCVDRPDVSFHIVADRRNTVEYITRQIEAEYAYKYAFPLSENGGDSKTPTEGFVPLEVGELTTANSIVLKYENVIGESLDVDLVVNVVNVFEINGIIVAEPSEEFELDNLGPVKLDEPERSLSRRPTMTRTSNFERTSTICSTTTRKSSQSRRRSIMSMFNLVAMPKEPIPNMDDALLFEMLRNTLGIDQLIAFCLTDFTVENLLFWLDVQVFRSCPEGLASQFGGYIYNMYLVTDAPVKVNVSGDLMYDINAAIVNQVGVDMTMFDYAQQHAYSLLKMKTLTRFKKSKNFAHFESFRLKNEELYKSKSFAGKFYDGLGFKQLPSLADDAPKALKEQSENDIDHYRDRVLERVILRYSSDCHFFQERGYYADPDHSQEIDRTQRKKMEKKLSKFFGERPGANDLDRQKYMIDCLKKAVADTNAQALLSQFDQEASQGGSESSSLEMAGVNADGSVNVAVLKKKKFEKLVDFFGEPLPRDERKFMNNDHMLQYPENAALAKYKSQPSLDALEAEAVDTVNDLTPDEKRNMTKKARKIINVLGDQSAEKKLRESRGSFFTQRPSTSVAAHGVNLVVSKPDEEVATPLESSLEKVPGTLSDSSEESDEGVNAKVEFTEEEMKQIRKLRKKRLSKLTAFLGEEAGMIEVATAPTAAKNSTLTKEEKVQQRKRLQKLERMMGELVTTDILENALDVTDAETAFSADTRGRRASHSAGTSPAKKKPMTVYIGFDPINELKEVRTVNAAIETPTAAATNTPTDGTQAASRHHSNLVKLNLMLQEENIHRALDLMDEMLEFNIDATTAIKSKNVRKKKLKKLRKFFGDTLNPVQLFEQNVVAELEMTIADEVNDPVELQKLNAELSTLRGQVALRISDLQQGWDERQSRRSQTSVERPSANSTKEQ
ncbi:hypothetical protein HDU77_010159 [Chytriomyces hyalinus]|nr:hypothetical protein HDU77_010159 [Chytriomyces hyalinus]